MLVRRRIIPGRLSRGFTLIELITVITIMGVLAGLAAPSFQSFIANQRVRNVSFDLMAALLLARSEAVTRNDFVSLSKEDADSGWNSGWRVLVGNVDDDDHTLLQQESLSNLSITDSADLSTIIYGKDGRASTGSTKFTITPSQTMSGVSPRCISIGPSGVPSSKVGAC